VFGTVVDDIKLNSSVFHWPDNINGVFDLSQNRLASRRELAEEKLRKKIAAFEEKLLEYNKEIETFRKKEVGTTTAIQFVYLTYCVLLYKSVYQMCDQHEALY